jgi:drug/metabolite transporter (DMT)-like permease
MVAASALFAAMGLCTRLAARDVPWSEVAAARALLGAAVAIAVARARRAPLAIHDQKTAWARSLCGTGAMICTFYTLGAPDIALGDAVTLGATTPIFIALLSPRLLGETSGKGIWIPTAVAFTGAALVAGPRFHLAGSLAAIALLGAVFSALAMIWLRRLSSGKSGAARESPEAIVTHFSTVAGVAMTALALPVLKMPDPRGALLLVATGTTGALAQIAMTRAYALDRAARVGAASYLGIVMSHLGGAFLLGERTSPIGVLGAACVILAGLALMALAVHETRPPEASGRPSPAGGSGSA